MEDNKSYPNIIAQKHGIICYGIIDCWLCWLLSGFEEMRVINCSVCLMSILYMTGGLYIDLIRQTKLT